MQKCLFLPVVFDLGLKEASNTSGNRKRVTWYLAT